MLHNNLHAASTRQSCAHKRCTALQGCIRTRHAEGRHVVAPVMVLPPPAHRHRIHDSRAHICQASHCSEVPSTARAPAGTRNQSIREETEQLIQAAKYGHLNVVRQLLLESDVDVNAKGKEGYAALHIAAQGGYIQIARLLLQHGAYVDVSSEQAGNTPLDWAASRGQTEMVRLLLQHGAEVNHQDEYGGTLLHGAASWGEEEVVRMLLERGADPCAVDENDTTPLHWAARHGYVAIARMLLDSGADVNAPGLDGMTPLESCTDCACRALLESRGGVERECSVESPCVIPGEDSVCVDLLEKAMQMACSDVSGPAGGWNPR